jgi:hypothetical protein
MKRILLTVVLVLFSSIVFAQEKIAVFPFEDKDNLLTNTEAFFFYRQFTNEFTNKNAKRFIIVPRQDVEKLFSAEEKFQLSDLSAKAKTAETQRVLNGTQILSGAIGKVGTRITISVSLYTFPEFSQLPGGVDKRVTNKDALFDIIPELVQDMQNVIAEINTNTAILGGTTQSKTIMSANTGGTIEQGTVINPTEIFIEVKTDKGGELYLQGKKIATLWDNDTHTIPIEKPGTYSMFLMQVNGTQKSITVSITSRGLTKVNFSGIEAASVGNHGPSGGIIFYDKGNYSNGWRYMEAAPKNSEFQSDWNSAEVKCKRLNIGGFSNWQMPSRYDLNLMYNNLKLKDLGDFSNHWYWSSEKDILYGAYNKSFWDGVWHSSSRGMKTWVRAVRVF